MVEGEVLVVPVGGSGYREMVVEAVVRDGRRGEKKVVVEMDPCRRLERVRVGSGQEDGVKVGMDGEGVVEVNLSQYVQFELGRQQSNWPICYPYKYRLCRDPDCLSGIILEEQKSPLSNQPALTTKIDLG